MESIPHFEGERFAGRTSFSPALLHSAIVVAASRVDGVARLKSDIVFRLRNAFRRGHTRQGLVIRATGYNVIAIEICMVVKFGQSANDISYRVQEAVLDVARNKNLTDKVIRRVDVRITGIDKPAKGIQRFIQNRKQEKKNAK